MCLHRPWPLKQVAWLEWFLNGILACLKAFTGSDAAARRNGSLYHFDINIPFLQVVFGRADFSIWFSLKVFAPFCAFCVYYFHFHFRLATQGSSAMGIQEAEESGKIGDHYRRMLTF